jgi:hypothetical protein
MSSKLGNTNLPTDTDLWGANIQRPLCLSLNKKCPIISREKFGTLIEYNYIKVQQKMTAILAEKYFAITTDSWTAIAQHNNITCTAHFIEKKTWQLYSLVLGIFKKNGT